MLSSVLNWTPLICALEKLSIDADFLDLWAAAAALLNSRKLLNNRKLSFLSFLSALFRM